MSFRGHLSLSIAKITQSSRVQRQICQVRQYSRRYCLHCELTLDSETDTCDDLSQHASIYQLAKLWGLPYNLRRVAYQKYRAISQDMRKAEAFAASIEKILS
jgi:RNase P/RNase MRP subunit p30